MIDTWTLLNLVLAFLCGSYLIVAFARWAANYLAARPDLNSG